MDMYAIVAGCGKLGSGLAKVLSSQGHDVVAVCEEKERACLEHGFDGVTVCGNPSDTDVLLKAGVEKAQLLVAATGDDNLNVMVIQIARELFHVPMVLARISDPDREKFYKGMGLSTVCPTTTGINQIIHLIQSGIFTTLSGYIDPDCVGIKPPPEWIGKSPAQIALPSDRRMVGVVRSGAVSSAQSHDPIETGDTLILVRTNGE
jgi:trk system potassium uptake protein TrkA